MQFRDVLTRRRSVRTYADRPVPRDVLERIANAAVVWAPSAGFSQGLRLVVVTDPETRREIAVAGAEEELAAKGRPRWKAAAPVHVVVVTLGYPADGADPPSGGASVFTERRRPREDIVRWERW